MSLIIENGDCLELMKELPDNSIDLFICDLPYGETNCAWDCVIDLEKFWAEFRRLRKSKRTACIHFCSTKFGYTLIKSWEKGFKMDMVWKKRNKTGGLQSRHRPMRNHEMVYFFYEQAPKYNRDKYHKRIAVKNDTINNTVGNITNAGNPEGASNFSNGKNGKFFEPPNPASVMEEKDPWGCKNGGAKGRGGVPFGQCVFDPPNPASVMEEKEFCYGTDEYHKDSIAKRPIGKNAFEPPNPASVMEEKDTIYNKNTIGWSSSENNKTYLKANPGYTPRQPGSVVEEKDIYGESKKERKERRKKGDSNFEPPNPASVVEPEPVSMFESKKVFIGKRHHQTEKPLDILEFFIKYWTDEGDTILDPTMGSGSTGVACKKLNRDFIGFELDKDIYRVAEKRIN